MEKIEPQYKLNLSNSAKIRGLARASILFRVAAWLMFAHYLIQVVTSLMQGGDNLLSSTVNLLATALLVIIGLWTISLLLNTIAILLGELDDIREGLSQQALMVQRINRLVEKQPNAPIAEAFSPPDQRL